LQFLNWSWYESLIDLALAYVVRSWLLSAKARVHSLVSPSGICGGKIGTGAVFSKFFGPITMFICHRSMRCGIALTTRTLSYRRPYVKGFISGPALGCNRGRKHCFLLYMYPCSEPISSVRDKTFISKSSAVVLEHDSRFN
jgi:hypothetical protein